MGNLTNKTTTHLLLKLPATTPTNHTRSGHDSISTSFNLIISSAAAVFLSLIPYEEDAAGNRIPTIIFRGQPNTFHGFVLFVMLGFSASFSALFSDNRPKLAGLFRWCSTIFVASAAAVLLYAAFLTSI